MVFKIFTVVLIFSFPFIWANYEKENFCQGNRCLTCVGRFCTTTCIGNDCKRCPIGDCCDGNNCNICRGEKCCKKPACNECIIECLKSCQHSSTCHFDCFQRCIPATNETNDSNNNQRYGPIISNKNYFPVNVTTVINITNTIKNENVIDHPIIINTTNVNNFTKKDVTHYQKKHVIVTNVNNSNKTCCVVVLPEKCIENNTVCYTGRKEICSEICICKYVHIISDETKESQCIFNSLCGQFDVLNCDRCYCTGSDCSGESCPEKCTKGILPPEFYNTWYRKDTEENKI